MNKKRTMSVGSKVSLMTFLMVIVSTVLVSAVSYLFYQGESETDYSERGLAVAQTVAAAIDGDQFRQIIDSGEKTEYWYQIVDYIHNVQNETGASFLYVLDKKHDENVHYFADGSGIDAEDFLGLGDSESIEYYDPIMFNVINTGEAEASGAYDAEEFGILVSGFAPVLDSQGNVEGVVGVDLSFSDIQQASMVFGLRNLAISLAFSVVFGLIAMTLINRMVGKPIISLTAMSQKLAEGDIELEMSSSSRDEIGELYQSFQKIVDSSNTQIAAMERLADGDLSVNLEPRGQKDKMSYAIRRMTVQLREMIGEIRVTTDQVNTASNQIADGAQHLSHGSVEQASSVEELSASIAQVAEDSRVNADMARKAGSLFSGIRHSAEQGESQMTRMVQAVREIDEASRAIGKVMKVIDDIAFQTNILALNASVEAARAGQHGKGFAVVADEVRNLANKSAAAAKDTGRFIENSIEKAQMGTAIVGETAESFKAIVNGIDESSRIINEIPVLSERQDAAIGQINSGIQRVADIVQQNNATAEESAAASVEMSQQAESLLRLVNTFQGVEGGPEAPNMPRPS